MSQRKNGSHQQHTQYQGSNINTLSFDPEVALDLRSHVSMNMWALHPAFIDLLDQGFRAFFATAAKDDPLKAEYLLPIYIGQLLRENRISVKMLETGERWFGVTYREDKPAVTESFRRLIDAGAELRSELPEGADRCRCRRLPF